MQSNLFPVAIFLLFFSSARGNRHSWLDRCRTHRCCFSRPSYFHVRPWYNDTLGSPRPPIRTCRARSLNVNCGSCLSCCASLSRSRLCGLVRHGLRFQARGPLACLSASRRRSNSRCHWDSQFSCRRSPPFIIRPCLFWSRVNSTWS